MGLWFGRPFEIRRDDIRCFLSLGMISADGVDVLSRKLRVNAFQSFLDILEGDDNLFLDVRN
jgi:hypothetical protein